LIAKQDNKRMDVLTLDPDGEEEALPVFSYEEEAEAFLGLQAPGKGWRARETTTGELVSLLYGLCMSIEKVTLDPLPVAVGGRANVDLTSLARENFLRNFLGVDESPSTNRGSLRAGESASCGLSEGSKKEGERVRENGKQREGTENGGASHGASKGSDDLYIPDCAMRDFGPSDGSRDDYDPPQRTPEVPGEDLVPRRE
jgi:hypothetical protein